MGMAPRSMPSKADQKPAPSFEPLDITGKGEEPTPRLLVLDGELVVQITLEWTGHYDLLREEYDESADLQKDIQKCVIARLLEKRHPDTPAVRQGVYTLIPFRKKWPLADTFEFYRGIKRIKASAFKWQFKLDVPPNAVQNWKKFNDKKFATRRSTLIPEVIIPPSSRRSLSVDGDRSVSDSSNQHASTSRNTHTLTESITIISESDSSAGESEKKEREKANSHNSDENSVAERDDSSSSSSSSSSISSDESIDEDEDSSLREEVDRSRRRRQEREQLQRNKQLGKYIPSERLSESPEQHLQFETQTWKQNGLSVSPAAARSSTLKRKSDDYLNPASSANDRHGRGMSPRKRTRMEGEEVFDSGDESDEESEVESTYPGLPDGNTLASKPYLRRPPTPPRPKDDESRLGNLFSPQIQRLIKPIVGFFQGGSDDP